MTEDGRRWFLFNASPDVREQIAQLSHAPVEGVRHVPIEGIVLTDAELDHTLGIALLREGRRLQLCATRSVLDTLTNDSRVLPVTQAFAQVAVRELELDVPVELQYADGSVTSLMIEPFAVAGDPPRFARSDIAGHTVGIMIRDRTTGGACAFVPGCGALDDALLDRLGGADVVLFDGTFWKHDELIQLGIGNQRAEAMGHLPISGPGGSLSRLAALRSRHKVYTHINNTNRILLEDSEERRAVEEAGLEVGMDGMSFEV